MIFSDFKLKTEKLLNVDPFKTEILFDAIVRHLISRTDLFTINFFTVSHRHIVTAAHCTFQVSQATNIVAIVGTNNLQNRK